MSSPIDLNAAGVFDGAAALLKFGPLGLSALLLLLAASVFFIRLPPARERLLRQLIYVGAFLAVFFGVTTFLPTVMQTGVHKLHLSVQPLDVATARDIPRPQLTVNSRVYSPPLDISVDRELTAILDISEALAFAERVKAAAVQQGEALSQILEIAQPAFEKSKTASSLALSLKCSKDGTYYSDLSDTPVALPSILSANRDVASSLAKLGELAKSAIAASPNL